MGSKVFAPVSKKEFPLFKLIADVEDMLVYMKDKDTKEIKRSQVSHLLDKAKYVNNRDNPINVEINSIYQKTVK